MHELSKKISLRHLQAFSTLARVNSFSKAAQELCVTQPALSASIKLLENQLGKKLFNRTTHQLELTREGKLALDYATHLLNTASNTFADIQRAIGSGRHRIRIGAIPSAMAMTAAVVARYSEQHGDEVEIVLSDMPNDGLLHALHSGQLDFCVGIEVPGSVSLESVGLFEDELVLVTAGRHALAPLKEVRWVQLAGQEIVVFTKGSIWEFASSALRQHGLSPSNLYQMIHSESLYGVVRAGIAVGIMPSLYTTFLNDEDLHVAPLRQPTCKRKIALMRRNEISRNHHVDDCFSALRQDLQQVDQWF